MEHKYIVVYKKDFTKVITVFFGMSWGSEIEAECTLDTPSPK